MNSENEFYNESLNILIEIKRVLESQVNYYQNNSVKPDNNRHASSFRDDSILTSLSGSVDSKLLSDCIVNIITSE